jgi:hypothetical protein
VKKRENIQIKAGLSGRQSLLLRFRRATARVPGARNIILAGDTMNERDMTILRATIFLSMTLIFLSVMMVTNVEACLLAAQPPTDDHALQLLVIELFFLLVGLVILAILGYLLWQSWHRRKKKANEKGK